jgi:hypothetical protein
VVAIGHHQSLAAAGLGLPDYLVRAMPTS